MGKHLILGSALSFGPSRLFAGRSHYPSLALRGFCEASTSDGKTAGILLPEPAGEIPEDPAPVADSWVAFAQVRRHEAVDREWPQTPVEKVASP